MVLIIVLRYGSKKMENSNFGENHCIAIQVIMSNTFHLIPKAAIVKL